MIDEGLLARCLDALETMSAGEVRHKNVFGMRGLLRGSRMFAAVGDASMIVKCRASEYASALERSGVQRFSPGGQQLGTWLELEQAAVADDPDLREWLEVGLRALSK
jgi:TfoX/Sxy family transcriptional regulator of competence genes